MLTLYVILYLISIPLSYIIIRYIFHYLEANWRLGDRILCILISLAPAFNTGFIFFGLITLLVLVIADNINLNKKVKW